MKPSRLVLWLLACVCGVFAFDAPLVIEGADEELLLVLADDWTSVDFMPAGFRLADPYPRLRELLGEGAVLYLLEILPAPTGAAVSGRVIGSGGYDRDLGTIYTTSDTASLALAVYSLWDKVEGALDENEGVADSFRPSVERISRELTEARGFGTARPRGELTPEPGRLMAHQDAYHLAVEDFLAEIEDRLYLGTLLTGEAVLSVQALVRSGLYVLRSEHRPDDQGYTVEVRLKPEVVRTLTRIVYRELRADKPSEAVDVPTAASEGPGVP